MSPSRRRVRKGYQDWPGHSVAWRNRRPGQRLSYGGGGPIIRACREFPHWPRTRWGSPRFAASHWVPLHYRKAWEVARPSPDQHELEFDGPIVSHAAAGEHRCSYFSPQIQGCYVPVGTGFAVREGIAPSEAILDIYRGGGRYMMDCATGIWVVYFRALLFKIGPVLFDSWFRDLRVAIELSNTSLWPQFVETAGDPQTEATPKYRDSLPVGQHVYFQNWGVNSGRDQGWNAIYLGADEYFVHYGAEVMRYEEDLIDNLTEHRLPGARSPSLCTAGSRLRV